MLILYGLLGLGMACNKNADGTFDFTVIPDENAEGASAVSKLTQKSHPFMKQLSDELKEQLSTSIMSCLLTRRNPMDKQVWGKLGNTQWFTDWNRHCGELLDPACPGQMGECWAMGVLMCRKNCDAKFELRGNRKKFKRCIYRELKIYEKEHPGTVDKSCTVLDENGKPKQY